jgi:hypothetical protein
MADDDGADYTVGYGRPPRQTRFQKGQSGNRRGRPKGTLNLATTLLNALLETVTVNERGIKRKMTKLDVAIRQQTNKAASGDGQALKLLTQLHRESADGTNLAKTIEIVVSETDLKL